MFEQRLLLDALLELEIPPAVLAGCAAVTCRRARPRTTSTPRQLVAGGQSMGGMYTNMVGSVEPRFGAVVPTGAGGLWNLMILDAQLMPGARELVVAAFATDGARSTSCTRR